MGAKRDRAESAKVFLRFRLRVHNRRRVRGIPTRAALPGSTLFRTGTAIGLDCFAKPKQHAPVSS